MSKNIDPFDELTARVFSEDSEFYNRTDQLIRKNGAGRYFFKMFAVLFLGFFSIIVALQLKIIWLGVLTFIIMTSLIVKMLTSSNFLFLYIEDYIKRNNR